MCVCLCVFACTGSENNSLYLYYKGLSKTLLTFKFDTVKSVLDKDKKEDDTNEFVSAVCWRALPDGVSSPHYYTVNCSSLSCRWLNIHGYLRLRCVINDTLFFRSPMYWLLQTVKEQSRFVFWNIQYIKHASNHRTTASDARLLSSCHAQ